MKKIYLFAIICLGLSTSIYGQAWAEYSDVHDPKLFTPFNNKLIFVSSSELYIMSSGTVGGAPASNVTSIASTRSYAYASNGDTLFITDGSNLSYFHTSILSNIDFLTPLGDTLLFAATDSTTGNQLFATDGNTIWMVAQINPSGSSNPSEYVYDNSYVRGQFHVIDGKAYFHATDGTHGNELWVTDGTTAGTYMVADINPGSGDSWASFMTKLGSNIVFAADDGTHGSELWIIDSAAGGASMVLDINQGGSSMPGSNNTSLTVYNGHLFFGAFSNNSFNMWTSDGTAPGTYQLSTSFVLPSGFSGYHAITTANYKLYFAANDGTTQLWSTDGSMSNTVKLMDIGGAGNDADPRSLMAVNNGMIFSAAEGANGRLLWYTDGTPSGTFTLGPPQQTVFSNTMSTNGGHYIEFGGLVFMNAHFDNNGSVLWTFDPTNVGINKTLGDNSISIYPNPFTESIHLKGLQDKEQYLLQVSDVTGRICYTKEIDHPSASETITVSLSGLKTGMYVVQVKGTSGQQTWKMVKD